MAQVDLAFLLLGSFLVIALVVIGRILAEELIEWYNSAP